MSGIAVSRVVHAPAGTVWHVATDLEAAPQHMSAISRVDLLTGHAPFGVGTRWRETRKLMGREETEELVVTAVEGHESYTVEAESHGVHYVSTFRFEPLSADTTDLIMTFDGTPTQPQSLFARLTGRVGTNMVRRTLDKDLADLAAAAERRTRSS